MCPMRLCGLIHEDGVVVSNVWEERRVKEVQPTERINRMRKEGCLGVIMRPVSLKAQPMDNGTQ